jgi:hypothetical protein
MSSFVSGDLGRYFGDLGTCWWIFLVMLGISTTIAMIYLFLLRCVAKPLIYISFVLILAILIASGAYVFASYKYYSEGDSTRNVMKGMGILIWIIAGIYLIVLLCCCSRIRLAIAIMQAASDFVRNTFSIFSVPFVFFFFIAVWVTFWIFSAVYVYSVGDIEKVDGYPVANIVWSDTTRYVWIYHLFGLFWISAFIIGCSQFIIAATVGLWYFNQGGDSDQKVSHTILQSYKWIFRYHMGSIAFGAAVIAIMQMIKILFEYARRKIEKASGGNSCVKCVLCACKCVLYCIDKCVRCITKNAYI